MPSSGGTSSSRSATSRGSSYRTKDWASLPDAAREQVRGLQLRYVELWTGRLRELHQDLARSRHARWRGVVPPTLSHMALATFKDLCLDAHDARALAAFWAAALGLEAQPCAEDSNGDWQLLGPTPEHTIWVNEVPEPKTVKHRMHLDLNVGSVAELERHGAIVVDAESFSWTLMADPEGGEFCAFVREGEITERLYEIGVDCGDAADECHTLAAWWADLLGARVVDDERGFSWVEQIPGAPFESIDFVPVPEPKSVKNRIHPDVVTTDVDSLVAAGAVVLRARDDEIGWTVLSDPAGNEFCAFEQAAG